MKILQGTKYEAYWGELIPVFSRSWEKGKFEHIFLTVGFKKFKVARPCFFLGEYLPSLRINYVAVSKDMGKRSLHLYYIKMKISYDLGFFAIGVADKT